MFERFTDNARAVVVAAQNEARYFKHSRIGTEHILLGLFNSPSGIAVDALQQLGITRDMVRADIESMIGKGDGAPSGHIPFSPRAKKVLELALREALQLSHNYIGTEHILLALEREGDGVAVKILASHVENTRDVVRTVKGLIAERTGSGGAPPRPKRTSAADEVVTVAEALAGGAPMGSHHLLEALIRAEGSMAATVLARLGVSPDAIADTVDEIDTDATTDATPQETAARMMEIRIEGDEVHLVFRDEATLGMARTVNEVTGEDTIRATGPVAGRFVPLWTQLNELLMELVRTLRPEKDDEGKAVGKAALLVRRVLHDRLLRRQPPGGGGEQAEG
jgi:ATP-dependent Clp protease ATP-binding subunit ClpA